MVVLKEVEIKQCFSLTHEFLKFEESNYATIFNCAPTSSIKHCFINAIRPFFCKDGVDLPMDGNTEAEIGESFVRIKFLLPKSEEQTNDETIVIDAMRLCHKPEEFYYYFDEEQYIDPIEKFHKRCRFDVTLFYPFLEDVFTNEHTNLMHHWFARPCPLRAASQDVFENFAEYLKILNTRPEAEQREIIELAQMNISLEIEAEIEKRRTFVQIANEIGNIFHRLTFNKYCVKFHIPLIEDDLEIDKLKWKDLDFINVVTKVNKCGENEPYLWNQTNSGLKFLLKAAQMIAYAKHLGIEFVFIEDTSDLKEYQNTEMIKEALLQKDVENEEADWQQKNFIKQITDVCHEANVMIVINYHGILTLPPPNTNVIKIRNPTEDNSKSLYICEPQPLSLDGFIQMFMPPLQEQNELNY